MLQDVLCSFNSPSFPNDLYYQLLTMCLLPRHFSRPSKDIKETGVSTLSTVFTHGELRVSRGANSFQQEASKYAVMFLEEHMHIVLYIQETFQIIWWKIELIRNKGTYKRSSFNAVLWNILNIVVAIVLRWQM